MILCCDTWPDTYSSCTVVASECPAPRLSIALTRQDADAGPTCPAGWWDCLATEWDSCCNEDCSKDGTRCAIDLPAPRPSCCVGYCGMVGSSLSPECASGPAMASGCCDGDAMALAPGAPITSSEWSVAFDLLPPDASSPAPDASEVPEASPEAAPANGGSDNGVGSPSGGCSVARSAPSPWALALLLGLAVLVRRRR